MKTLNRLGYAGLNQPNGGLVSFDAVARFITENAKLNQSAARTLAVLSGLVYGSDGFWRNLKQWGGVLSQAEVENAVRWRVRLAASLLGRARSMGHFEVDSLLVDALEGSTLGDWRLGADIGSAVRPTGDHVTAALSLLDWFRAMDHLIAGGEGIYSGKNEPLGGFRMVCRNTGADERPVRWDYSGEQ
jgi:hypothetical protein